MSLLTAGDTELIEEHMGRVIRDVVGDRADDENLTAGISLAVSGGKKMRPALVFAAYDAFGGTGRPQSIVDVAIAYELLHAGFIVHDDIIDDDLERRGTVNTRGSLRAHAYNEGAEALDAARLGDAGAIIIGDLLLHAATRLIGWADVEKSVRDALGHHLDRAMRVTALGEWVDALSSTAAAKKAGTPAATFQVAHDKTAVYSFSSPLASGAILAGASQEVVDALVRIGSELGTAYQLCDDLIGTFGADDEAGRSSGSDLTAGRETAVTAVARQSSQDGTLGQTLERVQTGQLSVVTAQLRLVELGARDAVERQIEAHLSRAVMMADGPAKRIQNVVQSVAYTIRRRVP